MNKINIAWPWRLMILFQAAMVAWIGFTHGSGLELYLFKFEELSYKTVFKLDHNLATLVALLGLLTLWRAYSVNLGLLSIIYGVLALMSNRYGGFVDEPYPLLHQASLIALPLSLLALDGRIWAARLGQVTLFVSLVSYAGLFLNAPPYYLDAFIGGAGWLGMHVNEATGQPLMLVVAVLLMAAFLLEGHGLWQVALLGLLSISLSLLHLSHFRLIPESLLKLCPLGLGLVLWARR